MEENNIEKYIEDFNRTYQGQNYKSTESSTNEFCKNTDDFIKDFKASSLYREPTFMEITKYPHYEKVCSNILSFYFDANREHNFGNLILKSFLMVANIKLDNLDEVDVYTEYPTETGKSIDLVLYNRNYVIGIENKIKATVYNDLTDYSNTLDGMNENVYKFILSMKDESKVAKEYGYLNITYDKFIDNIKMLTKDIWDNTNKWHIFLNEFIVTMKNLKGEI